MNKAPILTDDQIFHVTDHYPRQMYRDRDDFCDALPFLKSIAQKQLDSAHLHYMGLVREIFEALEMTCNDHYRAESVVRRCHVCFDELKSRFLEGENG